MSLKPGTLIPSRGDHKFIWKKNERKRQVVDGFSFYKNKKKEKKWNEMIETKWPYNFDVNLLDNYSFSRAHEQRIIMGKKIWLSIHLRNFGSDKTVRTYARTTVSSKTARLSYIHFQS